MPLKHNTETLLVIVLGALTVLAGVVSAFLPPLSVSMWPWTIAFVLSLLYPLALYPLLKNRRADYEFRALHFFPAFILFVWLVLELLASYYPDTQVAQDWYTRGWSALIVSLTFVLLIAFCLRVIRERTMRIVLLLVLFVPYIVLSQFSDNLQWERKLAATLWDGSTTGTGLLAGNLDSSDNPTEERWRRRMRRMEQRRQAIEAGENPDVSTSTGASQSSSSMILAQGSSSSVPPHLPSSGAGLSSIGILLAASYCTTLHRKTMKRMRSA